MRTRRRSKKTLEKSKGRSKRRSKKKKRRTVAEAIQEVLARKIENTEKIYAPWGGHMVDPPEDCPLGRKSPDGGFWVNCVFCATDRCGKSKDCERRNWFEKATREKKVNDMRLKGVKI